MSRIVLKHGIGIGISDIALPSSAEFRAVQFQDSALYLWLESIHNDDFLRMRRFLVVFTGIEFPDAEPGFRWKYLGTAQGYTDGYFVVHVYQQVPN